MEIDETEAATPQEFHICDEKAAAWLVGKLVGCDEAIARIKVHAEILIREHEQSRERLMHRFGHELEAWAQEERARTGGRRKSVRLLTGVVGWRAGAAKIVIGDEKAALSWAKENLPQAVVVEERFVKSAFNERYAASSDGTALIDKATGELVEPLEFCCPVAAAEVFYCKGGTRSSDTMDESGEPDSSP
jgi:phage host-nuclease inhibitor protein Gam